MVWRDLSGGQACGSGRHRGEDRRRPLPRRPVGGISISAPIKYNEKGLLTNKVLKNNICMIDNKFNFQEKDIKNTIINKTIDKELNDELNKKQLPVLNVT